MVTSVVSTNMRVSGDKFQRPSVAVGREIARLKRQGEGKCPVSNLSQVEGYYQERFGGVLPQVFRDQIHWAANKWPFVFSLLLEKDILPLDITVINEKKRVVTIVEFFRDYLKIDDWTAAQVDNDLMNEMEYLIVNPFGALLRRGLDHYMKLFEERLELLPVARPSQINSLQLLGKELVEEQRETMQEQNATPTAQAYRMQRPGYICDAYYTTAWKDASEAELFHRQCWKYLYKAETAVDYLLAGGEVSNVSRNHPQESIWGIVRKTKYPKDLAKHHQTFMERWGGNGDWSDEKPFVSVTTDPKIIPGIRVQGNLFIDVETDRAIRVFTNPTSLCEPEWFVPFVINPAEIVKAEIRQTTKRITMWFFWNDDFTELEVKAHTVKLKSGKNTISSLLYRYDPANRSYVPG